MGELKEDVAAHAHLYKKDIKSKNWAIALRGSLQIGRARGCEGFGNQHSHRGLQP